MNDSEIENQNARARAQEQPLRLQICRVGKSLFDRGYVHATAGNISVRVPEALGGGYLITPSDASLGLLVPEEIARVTERGEQLAGLKASKTLALHRHIYDAAPDAQCVIHTHSSALVGLTLAGGYDKEQILPPITPYQVMKVGRVPLIAYRRPGDPGTGALVAAHITAARLAGRALRAVMLDRLGPNVWHDNLDAAMATLEELEETAKLWLQCQPRPVPLDDERLQELEQTFGCRW